MHLIELSTNEPEIPSTTRTNNDFQSSPVRPRIESKIGFTAQVDDENMDQVIHLQKEQVKHDIKDR